MSDKEKETQLREEDTKKVYGGATNPISGGILCSNETENNRLDELQGQREEDTETLNFFYKILKELSEKKK